MSGFHEVLVHQNDRFIAVHRIGILNIAYPERVVLINDSAQSFRLTIAPPDRARPVLPVVAAIPKAHQAPDQNARCNGNLVLVSEMILAQLRRNPNVHSVSPDRPRTKKLVSHKNRHEMCSSLLKKHCLENRMQNSSEAEEKQTVRSELQWEVHDFIHQTYQTSAIIFQHPPLVSEWEGMDENTPVSQMRLMGLMKM
ncbi:unnamed protein product [Caenorhabditis brenneri]